MQFVISGNVSYQELDRVATEVLAKARQSGVFAFVNKDLRFSRPEVGVSIDRELSARLGISMEDIGRTLQIMLGEVETNRFSIEGRSYKVIPQADRGFRLTKEWLERYYVRTESRTLVPLSTVISLKQEVKPNTLRQFQQLNSVTIGGLMLPPNSLGDGLAYLERALHDVAPAGYRIDHAGESRRFVQESQSFLLLFGSSLLFIYLVLSAQFNSFRDPLIVLVQCAVVYFRSVGAAGSGNDDAQHLHAGRLAHPYRAHQQARHTDRGLREQTAARRRRQARCGAGGGGPAPAAHSNDDLCDGDGRVSAAHRLWRRCERAVCDRADDRGRYAGGNVVHAVRIADVLYGDGGANRRSRTSRPGDRSKFGS